MLTIFQLVQNVDLLVVIIVGMLLIYASRKPGGKRSVVFWIGWFMIGLSVLSTFTFWLMLAVGLAFAIIKGGSLFENLQVDAIVDMPWKQKKYMGVETKEPVSHAGKRRKQQWLGNQHIGEDVYEWNDINISLLMGDTIIDLGNTLLPNEENVVLLRKGLGQTRIIVPMGVGVSVHHSVLKGTVTFDHQVYPLSNETITLYSKDYDTATRTIKIVSNSLLGDFEVIYL